MLTFRRLNLLDSRYYRNSLCKLVSDPKPQHDLSIFTRCTSSESQIQSQSRDQLVPRSNNKFIVTQSSFSYSSSLLKKLQYKIGIGEVNKFALRRASVFHYQACTDKLDFEDYFDKFRLPDTVFSFFLVIQMHVWMCQTRSMAEGPEGRLLRNEIIERMWQDLDTRLQRVELYVYKLRKVVLEDLLFHHQAAILSYDEGLLTDDKTLANALWRTLYSKGLVEPDTLEFAVKYVRTQMNHLRSIGPREWCLDGKFDWAPFPPLKGPRLISSDK